MSSLPLLKQQVVTVRCRQQQQQQNHYDILRKMVTIAVVLLCNTFVLSFPSGASAHTIQSDDESLLRPQPQLGQSPPPLPQSRDLSFHSEMDNEDDDDDEDDPYRMVRVVVTIQNPHSETTTITASDTQNQWNTVAVKASSSSSSSNANEVGPIPWLPQSTIGGTTSTTNSTTPIRSSTTEIPFVPEPWLEEQYEDARAVSRIQRIKDPTTTSIVTFDIPQYRIVALQNDPDTMVYPMQPVERTFYLRQRILQSVPPTTTTTTTSTLSGQEEMGWGIPVVMGTPPMGSTTRIPDVPPTRSSSTSNNNNNDNNNDCFKICMVDAGVLLHHPDIPKFNTTTTTTSQGHIWGRSFNLPHQQTWDRPIYNHGTHVMGIMTAIPNNNIGIHGVLGNAYTNNMCFIIARVFDDFGNGQFDSYILNAVEWCADQNVRIINLSLGSPTSNTEYAQQVYDQIAANNTLIISSSGNTYDTTYNYPASFDSVISVGAIDAAYQKASFSSYNNQVNLVAPGVAIQSTVPQASVIVPTTNLRYKMSIFQYSSRINVPITGTLTNCGWAMSDFDCPIITTNDKICLAQRGIVSSYEKALTCQRSGGIALIIYDDVDAYVPFTGTLNITAEWINIPVVGITKADGEALVALTNTAASPLISLNMVDTGYEEISGTSMAVPFVSGIAAKLWYLRPQCTAEQIRLALYSSAKKLFSGISVEMDQWYFGNGLVQAEGAYQALLQMPFPCGEVTTTTSTSTPNGLTNNHNNTINSTTTISSPVTMTSGNATYSGNHTGYQYNVNDWWRRLLWN